MAKVTKEISKTGVVSYKADYFNPEGKRRRKFFALKKDADAYLGKVLAAKKEGRYHDVFDVKRETQETFNSLAARYVENFGTQRAFKTCKRFFLAKAQEHFGEKYLSQITYLDLETYRNKRKATPLKSGKPRTEATVNREMSLIGHMLNKAVEWDLLEASPFKKGKRLIFKENNRRLRFLTEAEIESLLKACTDLKTNAPHLRPLVETALHTGMRRGELFGLQWEQIRNGFIYLTETKSGKDRQIPINDRLAEVFREVRRGSHLKSPYVFCDFQGRRFSTVKQSFASACRRAGIEAFRFHDLRHTFASHLVMKGISLKVVQELLGHADLTMTMRYAHLSQGHLQAAVSALNDLGKVDTKLTLNPDKVKGADTLSVANQMQ
jgi:integrase